MRLNAATASVARLDTAIAARDADALPTLLTDEYELVDHTTGVTYDREGALFSFRSLQSAQDPTSQHEPLATLGDSLALCCWSTSASGFAGGTFDVGAYEREQIGLVEVDAQGRRRRAELFAADRLGDAITRLYTRYAELLPDGPHHERAAATARSVATLMVPGPEPYASMLAPAVEVVDHRTLGTWSARGAEAVLAHHRSLFEVADDVALRDHEVLGLRSDALLTRRTHSGTARAGGGAYERVFLILWVFGPDGLQVRGEYFDADREADALARFEELAAEPSTAAPATARITNAATRSMHQFKDALEARDWERVAAVLAPEFRYFDRRTMMHLDLDRGQYLEFLRPNWQMSSAGLTQEFLATRGNRLALIRSHFEGSAHSIGPSEIEFLCVGEVNDHGVRVATVMFDPDDLDAAYAELDRRFHAGEAAAFAHLPRWHEAFARANAARDVEALAALLAPDFVVHDHSPLGWGTLDRSAYVESMKALAALASDIRVRTDHLWPCERGWMAISVVLGSHEGGAFEQPRVTVSDFDAQGREHRRDIYTLEQLDQARARFAEIGGTTNPALMVSEEPPSSGGVWKGVLASRSSPDPLAALIKPNAATAALDRVQAAFEARDWEAMRAACAPHAKFEDRRRHALVSGDIDWWIADNQTVLEAPDLHYERTLVSIAGHRVDLERVLWTGGPPGGRFEVEHLWLTEVDERGRIVFGAAVDLDDRRAASRETLARWLATDAAAAAVIRPVLEINDGFNDHDRERIRAVLADELIVVDHRLTGLGEIQGTEAYVESLAVTWPTAPDIHSDWFPLLHERYGSLGVASIFGRFDGGPFEVLLVSVQIVTRGRVGRIEVFEIDDVNTALARFNELQPDPLRIPPNAAARVRDRSLEAFAAHDWSAIRSLANDRFRAEDRRKLMLMKGDVEGWIKNLEFMRSAPNFRFIRKLVGTVGDRLALERVVFTGGSDKGPFEVEVMELTEIDAEGRLAALIIFDLDDRRAAFAEAQTRFVAGEAAPIGGQAPIVVLVRAFVHHDWETLRGCLADSLVFRDHRTLGFGALGRDEWIESLRVLADLAPDVDVETLRIIAWNRHGRVEVSRVFGTLRDGGPFENLLLRVLVTNGDRIQHFELFDVGDADQALARFAELCGARAT